MIKKIIIVALIIAVLMITYIYYQVNVFKVSYANIKTDKLPKGENVKVLQISDVHNKKFFDDNERVYKTIEELEADMIVITGDLIDDDTRDFSYIYSFIDKLVEINSNVYYISGNHEWRTGRNLELSNELANRDVKVLNNGNDVFSKGDLSINVCGVDGPKSRQYDLDKSFDGINHDNFILLLAHQPGVLINRKSKRADLILTGHTHGGQIRVPFIGAVVAPGQGLFPKYDQGKFQIDDDTVLYIDSGLGTSTLPIRFLNRSQMSLITVSSTD